jgi:16S rRNA processing protein RimM
VTRTGEDFGRIRAVLEFGAGDMLELTGPDGKGLMVPFTKAAVPVVDIAGGTVEIDPPPGLLEPGEPEPKEEDEAE